MIYPDLIAPCGMNCALCMAYQREKNRCPGCRQSDELKPRSCVSCIIKNCDRLNEEGYCISCEKLPCRRMKQLDKRYRTKYGMSMIENLEFIEKKGMDRFLEKEAVKWRCPGCGGLFSVHRDKCLSCGTPKAVKK